MTTYGHCSKDCSTSTDRGYSYQRKIPSKDVSSARRRSEVAVNDQADAPENSSGEVGEKETSRSHLPFNLGSISDRVIHPLYYKPEQR
jgi:hypothetical protein